MNSRAVTLKVGQYPTWCVAHRGFSARYPENTHAAFEAALAEPIQAMELDIQLSRDDVPVIYHNRTLHLVGGGRRRPRTQTLAALQGYDYGAWFGPEYHGQTLVLLHEVLSRYGRETVLLLEIKRRERLRSRLEKTMALTLELVHRYGLASRCYLLCYDLDLLAYGHALAPACRFVVNQDIGRFLPEARFLSGYSVAVGGLDPALVRQAHGAGKPVFTFTCDRPSQLNHALGCGVDAVMANDPSWLAKALRSRGVNDA